MPAANTAGSTHGQCPPAPSSVAVLEGKGNAEGGAGRAPKHQRPRWLVRCYALNTIALGCGIPAEPWLLSTTTFRWRWMARVWSVINRGQFAGHVFWCTIERERPTLTVIEGNSNSGQLPGCRTSQDSRLGTGPQPVVSPGSREAGN